MAFPKIQSKNNNLRTLIKKTPNEIYYDFTLIRPLNLVLLKTALQDTKIVRFKIKNALDFAQIAQKFHYNKFHQPMFFKVGDKAFIKLHKEYNILLTTLLKKKLSQQYVGPFTVIEKVKRLAYKLNISAH